MKRSTVIGYKRGAAENITDSPNYKRQRTKIKLGRSTVVSNELWDWLNTSIPWKQLKNIQTSELIMTSISYMLTRAVNANIQIYPVSYPLPEPIFHINTNVFISLSQVAVLISEANFDQLQLMHNYDTIDNISVTGLEVDTPDEYIDMIPTMVTLFSIVSHFLDHINGKQPYTHQRVNSGEDESQSSDEC